MSAAPLFTHGGRSTTACFNGNPRKEITTVPLTRMTVTGTALGRDLSAIEQAVNRAKRDAELVPGARARARITLTVGAREAVDLLVAEWHVTPRWAVDDTQYSAVRREAVAELEAVWFRQDRA